MLNFDGKGEMRVYEDGNYKFRDNEMSDGEFPQATDGRIVMGRQYTSTKELSGYASVGVDELILFNQLLPEAEIRILSQQMCTACAP